MKGRGRGPGFPGAALFRPTSAEAGLPLEVDLQAQKQATKAARQKALQAQAPQAVGEMAVKGQTAEGKLRYAWEGREVAVTRQGFCNHTQR